MTTGRLLMQERGFFEIFVNNDAQTPVYYDNMQVTMRGGNASEVNAYYPSGYIINDLSDKPLPAKKNFYKYNNKELQEELGLNWLDYGARMMDPVVMRWWTPDPMAEKYYNVSPYAYCANNPILFIDPDGQAIRVASNYAITAENIARIYATNKGQERIDRLMNSSRTYTTRGTFFTLSSEFDFRSGTKTIYFVEKPWDKTLDGGALTSWTAMGHEIEHAYDFDEGRLTYDYSDRLNVFQPAAISFENYLREVYSIGPLRNRDGGNRKGNFHNLKTGGHEIITDFKTEGSSSDNTKFGFSYTKTTSEPAGSGNGRLQKKNEKSKKGYMIISIGKNNISIFTFDDEDEYRKNADW